MERTPSDEMSHADLLKLVLQLQKQLEQQAKVIARQAKRIEELESELKELRKKNPTQRLDDAYSVKAEEKRREGFQQDGKPKTKKQKSKRRGRISTAEKLAMATQEENIFPAGYSLKEGMTHGAIHHAPPPQVLQELPVTCSPLSLRPNTSRRICTGRFHGSGPFESFTQKKESRNGNSRFSCL